MLINQGDVYWLQLADVGTGIPHPCVIVQDDLLNHSDLETVVVCGITSNVKRATWLGNILLSVGEANLPKPSVIEVSKIMTVDKAQLGGYIGTLSEERVQQILANMRFLQRSFFAK